MRPLPEKLRKDGYDLCVEKRTGDVALVKKTKVGLKIVGWEVCIVQKHAEYVMAGVVIPAAEALPSSSTWGTLGWTFTDRISAEKKFAELIT